MHRCLQNLQQTDLSILFQFARMLAKSLQSCPTLCDPIDCSPPGSSVHEDFQARRLEWVATPSFRGSSRPREQNHGFFTTSVTWEAPCPGLLLFNHQVMSDFLWPHGLQHARFRCSLPSPGACSNSCLISDAIQPSLPLWPSPAVFLSIRVFSNKLELTSLFSFIHLLTNIQWNVQHELAGLIRPLCSLYLLKYSLKYSLSTPYLHDLLINASFSFSNLPLLNIYNTLRPFYSFFYSLHFLEQLLTHTHTHTQTHISKTLSKPYVNYMTCSLKKWAIINTINCLVKYRFLKQKGRKPLNLAFKKISFLITIWCMKYSAFYLKPLMTLSAY